MLPSSYQKIFQKILTEQQYLTLEMLLLLIQAHREVKLSTLASLFPQAITYESRKRNLQRFLVTDKLCIQLLWYPLVKYWIRDEVKGRTQNREQRRYLDKQKHRKYGYWMIAIDRTQWKGRNLFMATLIRGKHALPLCWEELKNVGNSDFQAQKKLLNNALRLFGKCKVVVLADREFHSPKLAKWLDDKGVYFALRQKKNLHFQLAGESEYRILKNQGFQPGMSEFYVGVKCGKEAELGSFNIAVYWKRKYRNSGSKQPWYILTNLPTLEQALTLYRCRWGIEQFFKDCKTGGYNLEDTKVNKIRFLALVLLIAIAYSLATMHGQCMKKLRIEAYAGRIKHHGDKCPRHSDFSFSLYGQLWIYGMDLWGDLAFKLMALKPHKRLFFQRGLHALTLIQQAM